MKSESSTAMDIHVSRETDERLARFGQLLVKWNRSINLVAPSSLTDLKTRHIADSLQLLAYAPDAARRWLDLGSGGGLPGLVVAIGARETRPDLRVVLVDSDRRKCAFLREAARELAPETQVIQGRIEDLQPQEADVISARALAPLPELFGLAVAHLAPQGVCLFLKGQRAADEIAAARAEWFFQVETQPSQTDPLASVLKISGLAHA